MAGWREWDIFGVLGLLLFLAGCAKPYDPPRVEQTVAFSFPGVMSYAESDDTRVVWLHGMCTHDVKWARNRQHIFASTSGLPAVSETMRLGPGGSIQVAFRHRVSDHELDMRYLVWSPLTTPAKSAVKVADARLDGPERASLNADLKKGLINDCFSDAVIYLGDAGDQVRSWVRAELCDALGGSLNANKRCIIPDNSARRKVVFVAESLGSKILSDGLSSIWNRDDPAIVERFADVQMVFLAANQLPLLDASDHRAEQLKAFTEEDSDPSLLDILAEARTSRLKTFSAEPAAPLHFVAFSDPNDLLSYELIPGANFPSDIRVTNILVSNEPTYLGLLERPDTAHCGYGWNPYVTSAVVRGYNGTRLDSINVRVAQECGLGD